MKVRLAYEMIEKFTHSLNEIGEKVTYKILNTPDKEFKYWFRQEVPCDGCSKMSGVYLITNTTDDVLYIGKAASNNLGAEIWGKFGAPKNFPDGLFANSQLAKYSPDERVAKMLKNGDVFIRCIKIEPKEFCSLYEVYLQAWCVIHEGRLPIFNKRIG